MSENNNAKWYLLHTYSGYESLVKKSIEQMVENGNLQDVILDIKIPTETVIEEKNGKRKAYEAKVMPTYVFIKLVYSSQLWFMLTNTRGVTGFVGNGTQPTPISEKEILKIKKRMGAEDPKYSVNYEIGEVVSIVDGPFKGFEGTVSEIDTQKGKLKVMVSMFGRETPVELDALQVKQL